jgi:5-carboxymethyl-2-hydroxymuconate isomerase
MPHFVIEHSEPIEPTPDFAHVMEELCSAAANTGVMHKADIKLRVIPCAQFQLNDGSTSFLHLTVSMLEGRTEGQKEALAIACRQVLVSTCPQIDAISVDIRDMDAVAYKKRVRLQKD